MRKPNWHAEIITKPGAIFFREKKVKEMTKILKSRGYFIGPGSLGGGGGRRTATKSF